MRVKYTEIRNGLEYTVEVETESHEQVCVTPTQPTREDILAFMEDYGFPIMPTIDDIIRGDA